jgi:serine/threonine protein phosphatase 1
MRTFAIGDIHGNFKALKEVLARSGLGYEKDKLVILGDVCDGGGHTYECVVELLRIKNRVFILGNHDKWFIDWYKKSWEEPIWTEQGGDATIAAYRKGVAENHRKFFDSAVLYHIEDNMLFVHGGLGKNTSPQACDEETLLWDREMIEIAIDKPIGTWSKIFVGHTPTDGFSLLPVKRNNVWLLDQGAGWDGRLTMMDIHTEEFWQSEKNRNSLR